MAARAAGSSAAARLPGAGPAAGGGDEGCLCRGSPGPARSFAGCVWAEGSKGPVRRCAGDRGGGRGRVVGLACLVSCVGGAGDLGTFEDAGQELDGEEQSQGWPAGDDAADRIGVSGGDVGGEAAGRAGG